MDWILTIVLGIIGALVGGFLAGMLGMNIMVVFTGLIFSQSLVPLLCYSFMS